MFIGRINLGCLLLLFHRPRILSSGEDLLTLIMKLGVLALFVATCMLASFALVESYYYPYNYGGYSRGGGGFGGGSLWFLLIIIIIIPLLFSRNRVTDEIILFNGTTTG